MPRHQLVAWQRAILIGVASATVILFVVIFAIAPLNGEDFGLGHRFTDEGFFERLAWVLDRSAHQIANWNARLGEQLSIFWLSMPKPVFAVAAVIAFLLLNLFTSTAIAGTRQPIVKVAVSIALLFALWPGLELFFWQAINAGYLHPLLFVLAVVFAYRDRAAVERLATSTWRPIVVAVVGLLAGLSFENSPPALLAFVIATVVIYRREGLVGWRTLLPAATVLIGWLILLTAPSTAARSQYYKDTSGFAGYTPEYIFGRVADVVTVFVATAWPLLILALAAGAYLVVRDVKRVPVILFTGVSMLVVGSTIAAPYTEPRSFALAWALMLAVVVAGVFEFVAHVRLARVALVVLCLVLLYFPVRALTYYADFAAKLDAREATIVAAIGTEGCLDGVEVSGALDPYPYRYVNNRDAWYVANPDYVSSFYDCAVVIR